jgi:hypothetical protein
MHAYEDALSATSTPEAPWYIVPADDKENARLIVSQVMTDLLAGLDLRIPELSPAQQQEMQEMRTRLSGPRAKGHAPGLAPRCWKSSMPSKIPAKSGATAADPAPGPHR